MKWFKLKFSLEYKNRGYIFAPRTQSQVIEWILHLEGTVEQKKKKNVIIETTEEKILTWKTWVLIFTLYFLRIWKPDQRCLSSQNTKSFHMKFACFFTVVKSSLYSPT